MKAAIEAANRAAGPEIINTTLVIPLVLIVAFTGLFFYMLARTPRFVTPHTQA